MYTWPIQTHLLLYQQFPFICLVIFFGFHSQMHLQMALISPLSLCFSVLNGTSFLSSQKPNYYRNYSSSHFLNPSSFKFILFNTGNQTQMQYPNMPNDTLVHSFNVFTCLQEIPPLIFLGLHIFFSLSSIITTSYYLYKTTSWKSLTPLTGNEL